MDTKTWANWWKRRGEANLELLLWALWDPIGGCPLDEYSYYVAHVVRVLREDYEADAPLAERQVWDDSAFEDLNREVQLERNARHKDSVDRLARLLAELRTTRMEVPLDEKTERQAAEKLVEWYGWEMDALEE